MMNELRNRVAALPEPWRSAAAANLSDAVRVQPTGIHQEAWRHPLQQGF